MKGNSSGRAFEALKTGDTVLLAVLPGSFSGNSSNRAFLHALLAGCAIFRHRPFENPQPGEDRKESSQWTKIPAPEPLADHSESKDGDEGEEDEEIDFEYREGNT